MLLKANIPSVFPEKIAVHFFLFFIFLYGHHHHWTRFRYHAYARKSVLPRNDRRNKEYFLPKNLLCSAYYLFLSIYE